MDDLPLTAKIANCDVKAAPQKNELFRKRALSYAKAARLVKSFQITLTLNPNICKAVIDLNLK
jgi:hypothetical protein